MMAQGDASNIANNSLGQQEKLSLLAMKALIEKALLQTEEGGDANAAIEKQPAKLDNAEDVDMLSW